MSHKKNLAQQKQVDFRRVQSRREIEIYEVEKNELQKNMFTTCPQVDYHRRFSAISRYTLSVFNVANGVFFVLASSAFINILNDLFLGLFFSLTIYRNEF